MMWNKIYIIYDNLYKSVVTKLFKGKEKGERDFDKIRVTFSGSFLTRSSDIFDNKEESLKLISKLRNSVKLYSNKNFAVIIKK